MNPGKDLYLSTNSSVTQFEEMEPYIPTWTLVPNTVGMGFRSGGRDLWNIGTPHAGGA